MGIHIRRSLIFLCAVALWGGEVHAQLKGEVRDGALVEYAIAVPAFTQGGDPKGELAKNLTETLRRDLALTGYFAVLDERSFVEGPEVPADKVNFKNWLTVGAKGLVKATLTGVEPVELEVQALDVAGGKKLLHKKYKANPKAIRKAVHSFARDLVQILAGERLKFLSSRIAFIEKSGKTYKLMVADFDGADAAAVMTSDKILTLPSWSADGAKIYYTGYASGEPYLYAFDLKTQKSALISDHPGLNTSASAAPDGKNIALRLSKDGNAELYLMNLESKALTRLTSNLAIDTAPSFSADGKEIAFVSNRSGNPHIYRLFLNDPARVERLTDQGKYNQDPDYSPDGKYIAFTGRDEFYMFDIFLFDVASRVISRLTQKQGKNENPSFSPEGRLIVFSSDRTGKNGIWLSNVKGDKQVQIYTGPGEAITPSWSPEVPVTQ